MTPGEQAWRDQVAKAYSDAFGVMLEAPSDALLRFAEAMRGWRPNREAVATAIVNSIRADFNMPPCPLSQVDDDGPYLRQADAILALAPGDGWRDIAGDTERLKAERDFLLARAAKAGSFSMAAGRWTGISSNAIVSIAFGGEGPKSAVPHDGDDLAACYRTVMRLPKHLLSSAVLEQLESGEAYVRQSYATHVDWARAAAEWPGWDALLPTPPADTGGRDG